MGGLSSRIFTPLEKFATGSTRIEWAFVEAFRMLHEYAREHVLLCLIPAFFIAGGISVFIRQESVTRYFGPTASKWVAYPVAAVSGTLLAVYSCTVLPLFAGIHMRGAGLGPAIAFLYSGPAIFATLTEVPILQGLIGSGMGNGSALTLLLAGPALSPPPMLVVHGVLGTKVAYVALVVLLSAMIGCLYVFGGRCIRVQREVGFR